MVKAAKAIARRPIAGECETLAVLAGPFWSCSPAIYVRDEHDALLWAALHADLADTLTLLAKDGTTIGEWGRTTLGGRPTWRQVL